MATHRVGKSTHLRVLKDTDTTIRLTVYEDGTATDVGTITIGIVDGNGDTVVTAGTAVTDNADGTYDYALDESLTASPAFLVLTWTEAGGETWTTTMEVVGSVVVTEAELRAFDNSAMSSASTYPDADLVRARDDAVDDLEEWTGRAWIRRYARIVAEGNGTRTLWVRDGLRTHGGPGFPRTFGSLQAATIGSTSVTVGNVNTTPAGMLTRTDGVWTRGTTSNPFNVTVEYEYGYDYPRDGVARIVSLLVRDRLVTSNISDRATSFTDELGTYRFATPGLGGMVSTIPEVNEWVTSHRVHVPVG